MKDMQYMIDSQLDNGAALYLLQQAREWLDLPTASIPSHLALRRLMMWTTMYLDDDDPIEFFLTGRNWLYIDPTTTGLAKRIIVVLKHRGGLAEWLDANYIDTLVSVQSLKAYEQLGHDDLDQIAQDLIQVQHNKDKAA